MDAKQQLLDETLKNEFNMRGFVRFVKEFFNKVEILSPDKENEKVWSEYRYFVRSFTSIGKYRDEDKNNILILAVKLQRGRSIDKARSLQRNFVSKLISDSQYDAAIVAFYSEEEPTWRLSFVRLDLEFVSGKVKTTITPAKRYSFLVGKGEPIHTAEERLYPIFKTENFNPNLDSIEEAFSVEAVTKDFFEKYKEKYLQLKEYLDSNQVFVEESTRCSFSSEQFAKKLMGQLAFLYFLQKKGWLGVRVVPHKLNEKQYKDAFYYSKASKDIIPIAYYKSSNDEYSLRISTLISNDFSDEDADILAGCFKSDAWGSGSRRFLRVLFDTCEKAGKNFFDDYLEPLFYQALNHKRGENDYFKLFNCKIPFLNGGLFDPLENYDWKRNKFEIPNVLFSNITTKGNDDADGILDIFDRYNFTMNEDEPLEKEVAVDPEMLGKIFENLLDIKDRKSKGAFYTPREIVHYMCQESLINYLVSETGIAYEDIKKFIVYGEIIKDEDISRDVELGSEEMKIPKDVFINLKTIDNKLANVRVADPAVGSGAFPMGILSEIVKARNIVTAYYAAQYKVNNHMSESERKLKNAQKARIYELRNPYKLKWETIKNSIYAVDIDSSAVDITKLRLWLSLVVDEDLEPTYEEKVLGISKQRKPHPLPNLDCNILCGNSLVDEFEGIKLFDENLLLNEKNNIENENISWQLSLFEDQVKILTDELFNEQDKLYDEEDPDKKNVIKSNIHSLIDNIIRAKLSRDNNIRGLEKYEQTIKQKTKPYFLWHLEFGKIFKDNGGFNIVIGNPPYVGQKKNNESFKEVKNTTFGSKYHQRRMDFFYFFFHKGLDLLRKDGVLAFITTNYFLTATYGDKLRLDIKTRSSILEIINFNELKVFESALGQHNAITILSKGYYANRMANFLSVLEVGFANEKMLKDIFEQKLKNVVYSSNLNSEIYDGELNYIRIKLNKFSDEDILNKMIANNEPLEKYFDVIEGIHTGADSLSNSHIEKYSLNTEKGKGIYVLTRNEVEELNLNIEEQRMIKPWFKNSDINRWQVERNIERYLIYYNSKNQYKNIPNIQRHLEQFKIILINRKVRSGTGVISIEDYDDFVKGEKYISYVMNASAFKKGNYYAVSYPREEYVFTGEKLVCPQRSPLNTFAFHNGELYASADVYFIKNKGKGLHLKYLLALLNSKLYYYWMYNKGKLKGKMLELYIRPLNEIPVPNINKEKQQSFIMAVDKILELSNNSSKNSHEIALVEKNIDNMVYKLFNLTQEEIRTVENSSSYTEKD